MEGEKKSKTIRNNTTLQPEPLNRDLAPSTGVGRMSVKRASFVSIQATLTMSQ
jgi:hypothetical protein